MAEHSLYVEERIRNAFGAEDNPAKYGKGESEEHLGGFTEGGK